MINHDMLESAFTVPGTIEPGHHAGSCRIFHAFGEMHAQTMLDLPQQSEREVLKVQATMVSMLGEGSLLLRLESAPELDVFGILPETFEVTGRHVHRLCDAVDAVRAPLIRRFLSDVFSLRAVYYSFWTAPGSQNHHHAFRGGLAEHTLEVAESIVQSPGLSHTERDIGIAYAMTHDLGKIWTYDQENIVASIVGHELAGLAEMHDPLARLERDWPQAGAAMRGLLAGRWRKGGGKPFLSVGKLVNAYDQASAERDRLSGREHEVQGLDTLLIRSV